MKIAVADASTLILLTRSGYLDCLTELFSTVKVPLSVLDEIRAGFPGDSTWVQLSDRSWIEAVQFQVPLTLQACQRLGRGETEVIEFARLTPAWSLCWMTARLAELLKT